jgi:O-antigen ligase
MKIFSLKLIFIFEFIIVALISLGFIPREAALLLTALLFFYVLLHPLENSLILLIVSIPLFIALPIKENFDSMASWRILLTALFVIWFLKTAGYNPIDWIKYFKKIFDNIRSSKFYLSLFVFLLINILSLIVAEDIVAGVKKILFLANIFMFYILIVNIIKTKKSFLRAIKALAIAGGLAIIIGFFQILSVFKYPLYTFWQFWAENVSAVFYGKNLSELLSYSNTWFSYYDSAPPTLRLFSIMPDSHSFAMICIFSAPLFLILVFCNALIREKNTFSTFLKKRNLYAGRQGIKRSGKILKIFFILSILGIILSGSRGAWLSIIFPLAILFYLFFKKIEPFLSRRVFISLISFFLLFAISVFYPPVFYKFQSWQSGQEISSGSLIFFERARSISDIGEVSNKGRIEIWRETISSIARHLILGIGIGNYPLALDQNISAAKRGSSAHNLYLDIATETGIPGILAFLAILYFILKKSWMIFRKSPDNLYKFYALCFSVFLIWILGYSFFDVTLFNDKVLMFFMVELGLLFAIDKIGKNNSNNEVISSKF